jgi:hypothetical protein
METQNTQTANVAVTSGTVGGYDPLAGTWRIGGVGDREKAWLLGEVSAVLAREGVDYALEVEFFHADGRAITDELPASGTWVAVRV